LSDSDWLDGEDGRVASHIVVSETAWREFNITARPILPGLPRQANRRLNCLL